MRVLVVEDDPGIMTFLKKGLKAEGYVVVPASDGEMGSNLARHEDFDIAIIDILLPKKDGHMVLRELREADKSFPVIMLSVKDDTDSKVRALNGGAVDYLTKPFDFEELLARMRVHLSYPASATRDCLQMGPLVLDIHKRELRSPEVRLRLTSREFSLLECFFRNQGKVLSRAHILNRVWNYTFDPSSNIVDVYIKYLREKLAELGGQVTIETIRGVGYRLDYSSSESTKKSSGEG